jgi:hypothetical protein
MSKSTSAGTALLTAALLTSALASGACNRGAEETTPVAETQTQTPVQHLDTPVSVTGCLRGGEARETFVLTASREDEPGRPVTYALNFEPGTATEDLRDHVGEQVAIEGVVRAQQSMSGYSPAAPAAGEPVGTAGEATVTTQTELAVRQLQVTDLRPLGEPCSADR